MSEPDKIDATSLADALREDGDEQLRSGDAHLAPSKATTAKGQEELKHSKADTATAVSEVAAPSSADPAEETGGYIIGDPETNEQHSPETLSPVSARSLSPKPTSTAAATTALHQTPATAAASHSAPRQAQRQTRHPESVHSLHAMFPDLDIDTVALVLETKGGNAEEAINALLQMNDPSFQAPAEPTQVDSDAALAASIAAEQDRDIEYAQQHQRRGASGRGGGGFAGLGGLISQGGGFNPDPAADPRNSYDPTKLTYQPRVRKTPASAAARAAYNAPPPSRAHDPSQSLIPGLPGPNEAKQWQEDLNRFAEAGMSKAASTFSALKAKAAASFGGDSSGPSTPTAGVYGEGRASRDPSGPGSQRQSTSTPRERSSSNGAFGSLGSKWSIPSFGNNSAGGGTGSASGGRNVSGSSTASSNPRGLMSPTGFDKDAATVGEDELAQILARGSLRPSPKDSPVPAGGSVSTVREKEDHDENDGLLDWGGAAKTKKLPSTSVSASAEKALPTPASPAAPEVPTKSQGSAPVAAAATGAVAAGAAASGLVAGNRLAEDTRPSTSTPAELHDVGDSDEEEYVSNPFADDD